MNLKSKFGYYMSNLTNCLIIFDISYLYSLVFVCYIFMTSPLEMAVGLWSLYGGLFTNV